jgi:hypothetical protein
MLSLTAPTGSRASRNSAPGTRRTLTSTGLTALMPPWMNVLSPQLITCEPPRISPGCAPLPNRYHKKASRNSARAPTRFFASSESGVRARSPSWFVKS